MPGSNDKDIQGEGGDRMLNFGAVRVHNNHLQGGRTTGRGCLVCSEGLEGALSPIPEAEDKPEVVESDGGDEKGDTPPPSDSWPDTG